MILRFPITPLKTEVGHGTLHLPTASTHSRLSNWQVTRVEVYEPREMGSAFEAIAVCFCQWVPIAALIEPLPAIESLAIHPA